VSPPFRYSTDQQPEDIHSSDSESEGHLSPSTSHDGTGDGGLEERKETKVEETEVHMRLVPLIRLSD